MDVKTRGKMRRKLRNISEWVNSTKAWTKKIKEEKIPGGCGT